MNNKKLYVSGIAYACTNDDLLKFFSEAGNVTSAQIIMEKGTNRSRGFGFVEMASDEEAQKAIEMFDNQDMMGRTIRVNVARPMEERAPRSDDRGGYGRRDDRGDRRERSY